MKTSWQQHSIFFSYFFTYSRDFEIMLLKHLVVAAGFSGDLAVLGNNLASSISSAFAEMPRNYYTTVPQLCTGTFERPTYQKQFLSIPQYHTTPGMANQHSLFEILHCGKSCIVTFYLNKFLLCWKIRSSCFDCFGEHTAKENLL